MQSLKLGLLNYSVLSSRFSVVGSSLILSAQSFPSVGEEMSPEGKAKAAAMAAGTQIDMSLHHGINASFLMGVQKAVGYIKAHPTFSDLQAST